MNKINIVLGMSITLMACTKTAPIELTTSSITTDSIWMFTTAENTDKRLSYEGTTIFAKAIQPLETEPFIFVDPLTSFQTIVGIGGAITDASAETFAKLPLAKQEELLMAYYDANNGIGYSLARTTMNSCDFSSTMYTYVKENDIELSTFDIAPDHAFKIPLLKKVILKANDKLTLFFSPWSPPAWMKDTKNMLEGGKLLPEYRQAWANYYVKFIQEYEKAGIPIWGFTVQNEPMAIQTWESCIYTAEEERDFIKNFLGPTMKKNNLDQKKLIAWDHNRDLIFHRASVILNDKEAAQFVWGIGMHWYEPWTGGGMQFENERRVQETFPDKKLFFTEGCVDKFHADSVLNWKIGEQYGYSMINDFNAGVVAWTDWNILLDEKGGPNHVGNYCHAPIIANTKTGELTYENSFFYIGHFSKFIKPGAKRVAVSSSRTSLLSTAFINPTGELVVVTMNSGDKQLSYTLMVQDKAVAIKALPHSIATFVIK